MDCFAALAMTEKSCRSPPDTYLAYADLAGGVHYRRPGAIRQGHPNGKNFGNEVDEVLNFYGDHGFVARFRR
jgi:hypothetical protein